MGRGGGEKKCKSRRNVNGNKWVDSFNLLMCLIKHYCDANFILMLYIFYLTCR